MTDESYPERKRELPAQPWAMAKGGKGWGRWDVAISGAHAFLFALIPHGDSIP